MLGRSTEDLSGEYVSGFFGPEQQDVSKAAVCRPQSVHVPLTAAV